MRQQLSWIEYLATNQRVGGSNPSWRANQKARSDNRAFIFLREIHLQSAALCHYFTHSVFYVPYKNLKGDALPQRRSSPLVTDFSVVRQLRRPTSTASLSGFSVACQPSVPQVRLHYRIYCRVSPTLATYSCSIIIISNKFDFVNTFRKLFSEIRKKYRRLFRR